MPILDNEGVQINYETIGLSVKPPLVLNHGNGNSLENWKDFGYVDFLKQHFYLILIDARGFGKSSKPHNKDDYSASKIVSDFIAVLDHLKINKAHYFGNSRGARMAFAFQAHTPERFLSYTLCAGNPLGDKVSGVFIPWLQQGMAFFIQQLELAINKQLPPKLKETFLANDHLAMLAANQSSCSFPEAFSNCDTPCLIIIGTKDPIYLAVKENMQKIKNGTLKELVDYTHLDTYIEGLTISSIMYDFIKSKYPSMF